MEGGRESESERASSRFIAARASQVFVVDGRKHIGIYAKRRIETGEELSYDYKARHTALSVSDLCCGAGAAPGSHAFPPRAWPHACSHLIACFC